MISRSLARRLNQLEDRFKPDSEPMTIRLDFVNVNREVTGSLEFKVGGDGHHAGAPGRHVNSVGARKGDRTALAGQRQMSSGVPR